MEHFNWGRQEFTDNTVPVKDDPGINAWCGAARCAVLNAGHPMPPQGASVSSAGRPALPRCSCVRSGGVHGRTDGRLIVAHRDQSMLVLLVSSICGSHCHAFSLWIRRYTDQMQVIAHMLLANLQDDVHLLLCDPDEFLAFDAPASLADIFGDCLQVGRRV